MGDNPLVNCIPTPSRPYWIFHPHRKIIRFGKIWVSLGIEPEIVPRWHSGVLRGQSSIPQTLPLINKFLLIIKANLVKFNSFLFSIAIILSISIAKNIDKYFLLVLLFILLDLLWIGPELVVDPPEQT